MIKCQKTKDLMLEALYGELSAEDHALFDAHLRACPECAAEYSVLGATLEVMDRRERPDPGANFWDGYWERLEKRMEREAAKSAAPEPESVWRRARRALSTVPRWAFQASAALALVVVGVLIGRAVFAPSGPGPAEVVAAAQPADPMLVRANDYIQRSKVLLLGLVNFDPAQKDIYGLNLPRQKQISRELLSEAVYLKPALRDARNERLRELVTDLEVTLLQIANLESEDDLEAVDLVRAGVDKRSLLLQINLSEIAGETKSRTSGSSAPADRPKI
ncbi:MAG: anti-sigma factor [Candidatus Aminicenantes bacterium]|nr:anti-sigma factor [Candidatus Aminicenantes bacterium]